VHGINQRRKSFIACSLRSTSLAERFFALTNEPIRKL
jgi:hypothetical protein